MTPNKHVEHSPSSAERWMACPGSIALTQGQPRRSTPESREGTAAHELAAHWLREGSPTGMGPTITVEGESIPVTEEMLAAVGEYVEFVRSLMDPVFTGNVFFETQLDLQRLNPPVPMRGTTDAVVYSSSRLHVVDLKYGKGVAVDAIENAQMMYYALGAVLAFNKKPKVIQVTIVQPRAFHPRGTLRSYEFAWEELVAFKQKLFEAAERTLAPDAPLVPGEHCRFCPARAMCPAQRSLALEVAQSEFEASAPLPAPAELSREQMLRALEVAPTIEQWFNSIREFVRLELEAGRPVPGWKLIAKRATRKWVDERAPQMWAKAHGIDPWQPATLKSPAQMEAAVKASFPPKKRPKLPGELFEQVSSGNTLVPEADPRPAVSFLSAQDEFNALPQGESE